LDKTTEATKMARLGGTSPFTPAVTLSSKPTVSRPAVLEAEQT